MVYLPKAATGVDYAYTISPTVGAKAEAVIIDGVRKPTSTVIQNSSTVEVILPDEDRIAPKEDVFNYCLPETSEIIEEQLYLEAADELVKAGRLMAQDILSQHGILRLEDLGSKANEMIFYFRGDSVRDIYGRIGNGMLTGKQITDWIEGRGISKESLGLTSIAIEGKDEEGIMARVPSWITELNGNIKYIESTATNGSFSMIIVITGLSAEGEVAVSSQISDYSAFERWRVV